MKLVSWGIIPTRSPKAKEAGTDGHLGFFTYESKGCVYQGEVRTPVFANLGVAKETLISLIRKFGFLVPPDL